jgi:hypothetical protein
MECLNPEKLTASATTAIQTLKREHALALIRPARPARYTVYLLSRRSALLPEENIFTFSG